MRVSNLKSQPAIQTSQINKDHQRNRLIKLEWMPQKRDFDMSYHSSRRHQGAINFLHSQRCLRMVVAWLAFIFHRSAFVSTSRKLSGFYTTVDAFQTSPSKNYRNTHIFRTSWRQRDLCQYALQSSSSKSESLSKGSQNGQRYKRRRKGGVKKSDLVLRSRSILNSFEQACLRDGRSLNGNRINHLLDSMVQKLLYEDYLLVNNSGENNEASKNSSMENLSHHILPKDASTLIRLLGRNGAHDAMLKFCRRYCSDIVDASIESNNKINGTGTIKYPSVSRSEAEESILFAYTAAIVACSKPPPTSLAQSKNPHPTTSSKHRSKSFLLSLLDEMEHGYCEDGRSIRPNSYTLTAVLLGIDGGMDAFTVLDEFEEKYGNAKGIQLSKIQGSRSNETINSNDEIVTVQVYNAAISACSRLPNETNEGGIKYADGWQLAFSLLKRMRRYGPNPNEQSYSSILKACAEYGQVKVAVSLLEELRRSSFHLTPELYLPLLKACANVGNAKMAQSLIRSMKESSLGLTTEHMNLYLSALAKCKLQIKALGVLREMIECQQDDPSITPDLITLNTVLSGEHCNSFRVSYFYDIFLRLFGRILCLSFSFLLM